MGRLLTNSLKSLESDKFTYHSSTLGCTKQSESLEPYL